MSESTCPGRNFFANRAGRWKGKFRFNQFGGTVGGPIWIPKVYDGHDKSFFFFSYEGMRRITGIDPVFLTVPTAAQRRGDFSNLRDAQGNVIPIFDPLTTRASGSTFVRTQFPGNIIPDNRISATAKALLALTPMPNTTPSNAFTQANNYITQEPKRFTTGFSISGAYTLSKLRDNALGPGEAGGSIQNIYNRASEKSVSGEDIPQRLVVNYLYELPFGPGKKYLSAGPLAVILGGWEVSGISTFSKERPLGIKATGGSFLPGARQPNLVGNSNLPVSERTFLRWFNTSAFAFPATAFALGNVSRTLPNTRRPRFQIWDISLQKNTRLKEGVKLEFRTEFFNAFNKTNFLAPNTQLGNAAFGQITAARTPRQIQFALKLVY